MPNILVGTKFMKLTKWSLLIMTVFVIALVLIFGGNAYINKKYSGVFLKGVKAAGIDIGGLSLDQAREKIQRQIDFVNSRGFVYTNSVKPVVIHPNVSAMESTDSSYSIVSWDIDKSLEQVMDFQNDQRLNNLFNKIKVLTRGEDFPVIYSWDRKQQQQILESSFSEILEETKEASFLFEGEQIKIEAEQIGQTFDYQQAIADTEVQIESLMSIDIPLRIISDKPGMTKKIIEQYEDEILAKAARGDFYMTFEIRDWNVPNDVWRQWLMIKASGSSKFKVGLNQDLLDAYLEESGIRENIETPVRDARFVLEEGRVSEFVNSQVGKSIDMQSLIYNMENVLNNPGELEVVMTVTVVEPRVVNQDVNDLGIKEVIGTGVSDFSGSPVNRVHNINVGAAALHGLLIAPGEEFSLVKALGEIDGEHGYRQELVIKGNETIPEYGGGLCQIGTTVFRGALSSGLDITARRNHSYRVSYYEPAGTDATIYSPWPDFKFLNDTANHILIQSRQDGTELFFDFWGSNDGRAATTTYPIIYNIVAPPATKMIKTIELAPGKVKCTERAHNGADAKFDYTVVYVDGRETKEETFNSHYIPWQEVCLLGVTEEEFLAENASSTEDGIE
jgi:vancomycin resistance protein YoaR